jgi:ribosomal-protein-serine acetyltransferase
MEPPEDLSFATLHTSRLELRPLREEHGEGLWQAVWASLDDLYEWMPWARPPQREGTLAMAAAAADDWYRRSTLSFVVLHQGVVSGIVSLKLFRPLQESVEIGYHLRSDLKGRGLMTEAVGAVVRYAFEEESLHRIELHAAVGNEGSIRVAEKNGFTRVGIARLADPAPDGGWRDLIVFDLLESEWQSD